MESNKSLDACPVCGAPRKKFDDNWDTFDCGVQRNVCSGYILESTGCLASLVEGRDARIASLTAEVERLKKSQYDLATKVHLAAIVEPNSVADLVAKAINRLEIDFGEANDRPLLEWIGTPENLTPLRGQLRRSPNER